MKRVCTVITSLLIIAISNAASADLPFDVGERLEYALTWGKLSAGKTVMEISGRKKIGGKDAFHTLSVSSSNEAIATFYRLNNRIDSYMDPENCSSLGYEAATLENERKKLETATFDRLKEEVTYEKNGKAKVLKTPPLVYDSISSIYYLRTLNLKRGEKVLIHTFSGGKLYTSEISYVKNEKIAVSGKIYDTLKLHSITKKSGSSKTKGELFIWLVDNGPRTPVKIKTKVKFGYLTSELVEQKD